MSLNYNQEFFFVFGAAIIHTHNDTIPLGTYLALHYARHPGI